LHPFTDFKDLATRGARVITKGQGIYVWDSEGDKLLDANERFVVRECGYGRQELADAAWQQMMTLPFYNSFFQTTNVPAVQLAPGWPHWRRMRVSAASSTSSTHRAAAKATTPMSAWCAVTGTCWGSPAQGHHRAAQWLPRQHHGGGLAGGMSSMHAQGDLPIPNITHIDQPYFYGERSAGRNVGGVRRPGGALVGKTRFWRSGRNGSLPLSRSRCKALAASSSRPPPIGPKSSASWISTAFC